MSKSIKHILKQELEIKVNGKLWLESEGERFFGPGPLELLEQIEETGSISNAAKAMNMSYKKAWELINHLNAQTNFPIVVPQAGGEKAALPAAKPGCCCNRQGEWQQHGRDVQNHPGRPAQ